MEQSKAIVAVQQRIWLHQGEQKVPPVYKCLMANRRVELKKESEVPVVFLMSSTYEDVDFPEVDNPKYDNAWAHRELMDHHVVPEYVKRGRSTVLSASSQRELYELTGYKLQY